MHRKTFFLIISVLAFSFVLGLFSNRFLSSGSNNLELHKSFRLPQSGIWLPRQELDTHPTIGSAWKRLKEAADSPILPPDLSDQDSPVNVQILARALVFARTGEKRYKDEVAAACMLAMGTERSGNALALSKQLLAYVLAADLAGLPDSKDLRFRNWLEKILKYRYPSGKTLRLTHEVRPNNWGTLAGASRLAAAMYLRDEQEIKRCAEVFKGWLGDRKLYAGLRYKDLSWQADPDKPVGINPEGSMKQGHSIDGVLPDDQRRGGHFTWPPPRENYVYTALQGAVAQAVLLSRCGYDVWEWEDRALLRAFQWLYRVADYPAEGDDMWMPFVINKAYGISLPSPTPAKIGKNVAFADWTHGS